MARPGLTIIQIFVEAQDAATVIDRVRRVVAILGHTAVEHGFAPNLLPGKTECVMSLIGPGVRAAQDMLDWQSDHAILQCGEISLRVVHQYRHLGTLHAKTRSRLPELCRCAFGANQVVGAIGRHAPEPARPAPEGPSPHGLGVHRWGHALCHGLVGTPAAAREGHSAGSTNARPPTRRGAAAGP